MLGGALEQGGTDPAYRFIVTVTRPDPRTVGSHPIGAVMTTESRHTSARSATTCRLRARHGAAPCVVPLEALGSVKLSPVMAQCESCL